MDPNAIIEWLMDGDVSIRYQTKRDLLSEDDDQLHQKISNEGWGKQLLDLRKPDGHWGQAFYQPKWISTHYTLLDLKHLAIDPKNIKIRSSIQMVLDTEKGPDGGIKPIGQFQQSDVCINGMFLNYACYFGADETQLRSVIDFLLNQRMLDGGYNCRSNGSGAIHSSLHTTISVLEGICEYKVNGYTYRLDELLTSAASAKEFILVHQLFRSDKSGLIINKRFLNFPYPTRWYYDIMRAMDYFQHSNTPFDERMRDALKIIQQKKKKNNIWNLSSKYPGKTHFDMEKAGKPSRWNTLRALRILKKYKMNT